MCFEIILEDFSSYKAFWEIMGFSNFHQPKSSQFIYTAHWWTTAVDVKCFTVNRYN